MLKDRSMNQEAAPVREGAMSKQGSAAEKKKKKAYLQGQNQVYYQEAWGKTMAGKIGHLLEDPGMGRQGWPELPAP